MTDDIRGSSETAARPDRATFDLAIRLVLLAVLIYWALTLLGPFVAIVLWSAVLTVALYPVFLWLAARLGNRPKIAATLITLIALIIVVGPAASVSTGVIENVDALLARYEAGTLRIPPPAESIRDWYIVGEYIWSLWALASSNLEAFVARHADELEALGRSLLGKGASAMLAVLQFTVSIIIAGFLFVPGRTIVGGLQALANRILSQQGIAMVRLAGATIRNVSRGVIGISLLQTALAAAGMLAAGIPAASAISLLVLVMGILNIGATYPIIAVAIWGWWLMDLLPALIFTVYMVPVAVMDNVLKPIVMAKGLGVPMLVVFIGVVAGAMQHGLIGLFLGPIVLAVAWVLLVEWVRGPGAERVADGRSGQADETVPENL